jgi:hypothetical protein
MQHERKTDVADLFRHVHTDAIPSRARALHTVDAAVVLLVDDVRVRRVHAHAMGIVSVLGSGKGRKSAAHPALSGFQSAPRSVLSKTPPLDMAI